MFKAIAIKAALGVGAIAAVGGSAALAGAPSITANLAAATAPQASPNAAQHKADRAAGTITKLSDKEMTIERQHRDPTSKALVKDDVTLELNADTAVYFLGNKAKHGVEVLKLGQDVGVRFTVQNNQKVARRVVIRPDHRAGRIISKDADGRSVMVRTREGTLVHVTTNDQTKFVEGLGKNRKPGSYADLKVGDRVLVLGQEDSQHIFDAAVVRSANVDRAAKPGAAAPGAATPGVTPSA